MCNKKKLKKKLFKFLKKKKLWLEKIKVFEG